ncbi:MAG: hypothetical protein ACXAC5_00040 [Promethearchaeota archaeon]|jgi:hypothetical protein
MPVELQPITRIPDEPQITTQGVFLAGTTATFFFTFADIEGVLFDPSDINLTVLDKDGTTVETGDQADKIETGVYAWAWDIPDDQDPGLYSIRVDYVVEQPDGSSTEYFTEAFVVGEGDVEIIAAEIIAFRNFVEALIGYAQRIPVFHEIGRLNNDRTEASFTFPRWNQPAGSRVFINGRLKEPGEGYDVNYLTGKVTFVDILSSVDEVSCSYTFRWFTDGEIDAFVAQAVEVFNQYPPHSVYLLGTLPPRYGVTVAHQAAIFALRRLIMDLHFQEPAKVFGGMERADKLMGSLENLKKNMEEEINRLYDQKKYGPYIGLTRTITVPEFTLPGGRSRWFRYLFKGS